MNWSHGLVNGMVLRVENIGPSISHQWPMAVGWMKKTKSNRIVSPGMNRHLFIFGVARERKGMEIGDKEHE